MLEEEELEDPELAEELESEELDEEWEELEALEEDELPLPEYRQYFRVCVSEDVSQIGSPSSSFLMSSTVPFVRNQRTKLDVSVSSV